jgi:hypothetical protein
MLGFGPLGAAPLGGVFDAEGLARTNEILETVVTRLVAANPQFSPPTLLHHFTSLEVARHILEEDDVRLTHAEYSNDQMELDANSLWWLALAGPTRVVMLFQIHGSRTDSGVRILRPQPRRSSLSRSKGVP